MMRRLLLLALLGAASIVAAAPPAPLLANIGSHPVLYRHGRGAASGSNPLDLPELTQSQAAGMFTFLGSFSISSNTTTGAPYAGGAMYVNGSTMYILAQACDQGTSFCGTYAWGIASLTLPTLTGTPDHTGGNGPTGGVTPTQTAVAPGVTPIATYTFTAAPTTGATSATFTSLPPGIAANAGWYLDFNGVTTTDEVTAISGNTVSWTTALPSGTYSALIPVYQWAPTVPWANANYALTGSAVLNGNMLVTGAATYDNGGETLGWVVESTLPMSGTSWGAINVPSQGAAYSRSLACPIYQTPSAWQSTFGPDYSTCGEGLSIASNNIPQGPSFQEFNAANITFGGATVPVTPALLYTITSGQDLEGRSFVGPFPLTTTTGYYPATLTAAPTHGATSLTISLPTTDVVLTGNVSTNDDVAITAITSGTISNSGIEYGATDSAGVLGSAQMQPSYDYAPGTSIGVGSTITVGPDPTADATADTITMTPEGHNNTYPWTLFFSDGSSAVGTLTENGSTETFTPSAPLAGCTSSCTTSITMGPMGDAWSNDYDGPYGTGFFVPGFSTFAAVEYHQYGPVRLRNSLNPCGGENPSMSYDTPMAPDTVAYNEILLLLYSAQQILNGAQGTQPVYQADPYATLPFPDQANVLSTVGCPLAQPYTNGWAYLDPANNILYLSVDGAGAATVDEYQMTPP